MDHAIPVTEAAGIPAAPDRLNHIAVLLVHGIGDLRAGAVMRAASRGLRTVFPELPLEEGEPCTSSPQSRTTLSRARVRSGSAIIDLTEFHWADVCGKIRFREPFKAAKRILGVVREFPSMAVDAHSSPALRWLASAIGISLAMLLSVWVVLLTGSLIELSLWPDLWFKDVSSTEVEIRLPTDIIFSATLDPLFLNSGYYWSYAAQLVALCLFTFPVVLGFAFFFIMVLALARRRLRPLSILLRTSVASSALTLILLLAVTFIYVGAIVFVASILRGDNLFVLLVIAIVFTAIAAAFLWPAVRVGNLLRDIVHYLGTGHDGRALPDREATRRALVDAIDELRNLGTIDRLVIVCHSLGSVVVADVLLEHRLAPARGPSMPIDLVTAGSPIRRLIFRLLPHRLPEPAKLRELLADGALPVARWFNAYRPLDYVGTRLTARGASADPAHGIAECPLLPRWHWPWGHSDYWSDPRFTRLLAERVVAPIQNARMA